MTTWYVYIVLTEKGALYTGITTDPDRRLREHLDMFERSAGAKGAKYFRTQKPIKIVYSRIFTNRADATRHERAIKNLTRDQKQKLVQNAASIEAVL